MTGLYIALAIGNFLSMLINIDTGVRSIKHNKPKTAYYGGIMTGLAFMFSVLFLSYAFGWVVIP